MFLLSGILPTALLAKKHPSSKFERWIWMHAGCHYSKDDWCSHLDRLKRHGINRIHLQVYTGKFAHFESHLLAEVPCDVLSDILPLAKERGMQVHAWIWVLMNNAYRLMEKHPDWYVVNRLGESSITNPPYVKHYRWLCPSKPEVREYLLKVVRELAAYQDLAGIHLDYIRFPDVILPVGMQPKYNLVQNKEMPQFDYCYCKTCRSLFKKENGIDAINLKEPSENKKWVQFREKQITNLANILLAEIKKHHKLASAAVFPTPSIAKRLVRQNWPEWNVDAYFPMMYHGFYNKPLQWLYSATSEGVQAISKNKRLYSGLFVKHVKPDELVNALKYVRMAGAAGVSFFSYGLMKTNDAYWKVLKAIR